MFIKQQQSHHAMLLLIHYFISNTGHSLRSPAFEDNDRKEKLKPEQIFIFFTARLVHTLATSESVTLFPLRPYFHPSEFIYMFCIDIPLAILQHMHLGLTKRDGDTRYGKVFLDSAVSHPPKMTAKT